ncbi:MAG: mechanosensitive ion channel family protein [Prevotella sp.]|jgi:small conductance mechanosensitive channel
MNIFLLDALPESEKILKQTEKAVDSGNVDALISQLTSLGVSAGKSIIMALLIFIVGRFAISLIKRLLKSVLEKRKVDATISGFVMSLVNILLITLLIVSVVSALGVNTTSFAALLASAGVAVGMALSGNLQNFAGGIIILLFKPFRAGDYIEAQGVGGIVEEIQIFHTLIKTYDNKMVYVPNGSMSSGVVVNFSQQPIRRVDLSVGVEYGQDISQVERCLRHLAETDERVLTDPAPFIAVGELADSSVNILFKVWVKTEDYWNVYFQMQRRLYDAFNAEGINIPYPQMVVHKAKD